MIVVVAIVVIVAVSIFFVMGISEKAELVDVGPFSVEDVTYNPVADEEKEFLNRNSTKSFISLVERTSENDWPTFVSNPLDDKPTKTAAILLLCGQVQITGFEVGLLSEKLSKEGNRIEVSEIISLGINQLDENDLTKENLLHVIDNLKTLEEFYLSKGLQIAKTGSNRYEFLYNYFSKVELPRNDATTNIDCGGTFGESIKLIIRSYNTNYEILSNS